MVRISHTGSSKQGRNPVSQRNGCPKTGERVAAAEVVAYRAETAATLLNASSPLLELPLRPVRQRG